MSKRRDIGDEFRIELVAELAQTIKRGYNSSDESDTRREVTMAKATEVKLNLRGRPRADETAEEARKRRTREQKAAARKAARQRTR